MLFLSEHDIFKLFWSASCIVRVFIFSFRGNFHFSSLSQHQDGRPGLLAKDKILSIFWYGKSAISGNEYAKERLGVILGRTDANLLLKALAGDMDAAFEVAKKYEAVKRDLTRFHS